MSGGGEESSPKQDDEDAEMMPKAYRDHYFVTLLVLMVVGGILYKLSRRMISMQRMYSTQGSGTLFTAVPSGAYETNKPAFQIGDDEDDGLVNAEEGRGRPLRL